MLTDDPQPASSVAATAPLRSGEATTLEFRGSAGDLTLLGWSAQTAFLPVADLQCTLLIGAPAVLTVVGNLNGTGALDLPLTVPALPGSTAALTLHLQAA